MNPDRRSFWIATLKKRRVFVHLVPGSDVRSVVGRQVRMIGGAVAAETCGTRSTQEEYARRVFISGLQRNVSRVPAGPRTPIGMHTDSGQICLLGGSTRKLHWKGRPCASAARVFSICARAVWFVPAIRSYTSRWAPGRAIVSSLLRAVASHGIAHGAITR